MWIDTFPVPAHLPPCLCGLGRTSPAPTWGSTWQVQDWGEKHRCHLDLPWLQGDFRDVLWFHHQISIPKPQKKMSHFAAMLFLDSTFWPEFEAQRACGHLCPGSGANWNQSQAATNLLKQILQCPLPPLLVMNFQLPISGWFTTPNNPRHLSLASLDRKFSKNF